MLPSRIDGCHVSGAALMTLLCLCAAPQAQPAGDAAFCATGEPTSVLTCLTRAYADRDLEAFRALLSDDFQFVPGDESNSWGVDSEIGIHEKMFASPEVQQLVLTIPGSYRVAQGDEPATWIISGVSAQLALDVVKDGEPKHYEVTVSDQEFRVRQVQEPGAHFVIYHWWQPVSH